jgi:hypothetical protein
MILDPFSGPVPTVPLEAIGGPVDNVGVSPTDVLKEPLEPFQTALVSKESVDQKASRLKMYFVFYGLTKCLIAKWS